MREHPVKLLGKHVDSKPDKIFKSPAGRITDIEVAG